MKQFLFNPQWYDNPNWKLLNGYEAAIYQYLVTRMNNEANAWPSYSRIANDTNFSRRKVAQVIKSLKEKGFVTYIKGSNLNHTANKYTIIAVDKVQVASACGDIASACNDTSSACGTPDIVHGVHSNNTLTIQEQYTNNLAADNYSTTNSNNDDTINNCNHTTGLTPVEPVIDDSNKTSKSIINYNVRFISRVKTMLSKGYKKKIEGKITKIEHPYNKWSICTAELNNISNQVFERYISDI